MKTTIALFALALILMGCKTNVQVPSNEVVFSTPSGKLSLKHPQNTRMNGVDVEIRQDGAVHAKIESLNTTNDPDVIQRTADGQAKIVEATGKAVVDGIKAAGETTGAFAGAAGNKMIKGGL
jgi:hypothetical protein